MLYESLVVAEDHTNDFESRAANKIDGMSHVVTLLRLVLFLTVLCTQTVGRRLFVLISLANLRNLVAVRTV